MLNRAPNRIERRQSGTTLIEVAVALLVLSFGMLGIVGVQAVSLRANQSAYFRTIATTLSVDVLERMRANLVGVENGDYDDVAGAATAACFSVGGCTTAQMAGQDILDWSALVAAALPSGDSVVCLDSTPEDGTAAANACDGGGTVYAIKIWWDDNRDGTAATWYRTSFKPL